MISNLFYRQYVNGIFALFSFPDYAEKFKEYLSSQHLNIHFLERKKKMLVYIFYMLTVFVKAGDSQLTLSEKDLS